MSEPTDVAPKPPAYDKVYLGDGVYAHFDGYHIWLTTPNQGSYNQIAIEEAVFSNLVKYRASIYDNLIKQQELVAKVFTALDNCYDGGGGDPFAIETEDEAESLINHCDGLEEQKIGHLIPIIEAWRKQHVKTGG